MKVEKWFKNRTFHHSQFSDVKELVRLKRKKNLTISVGLPTLNEAETIATELIVIKSELMDKHHLIDELAIVDSGSTDKTREIAAKYGADVYLTDDYLKEEGIYSGKGENLWKSLYLLKGDIILWLDADIKNIHPKFVYGLLGPLLTNSRIGYVKAFYERPIKLNAETTLRPSGGGRVTALMLRPVFNLFFPDLSGLIQPLSGEYAGRRRMLEKVPFFIGYGVETGLLIDICKKFGLNSIAQVDLDQRIHRNHTLPTLSKMAFTILQVALNRAGDLWKLKMLEELNPSMRLIKRKGKRYILETFEKQIVERPPMITVKAYREKRKNKEKSK
ncbi:glucosyl-3-phosphoglycerate synthase [bacterium]|nr:glucosyl-3-phosphoglycerate synthase [bacterium]